MTVQNSFKWKMVMILAVLLVLPMVSGREYKEPTNITGFQDLTQWSDEVLDYKFGIGIVLMTFFISFLLLKAFESAQALIGCLFFTAVVATGCWAIGILDTSYVISVWVLCGIPAILILWASN